MSFLKNILKEPIGRKIESFVESKIDQHFGQNGQTRDQKPGDQWSHQSGGGNKKALFVGINYYGTQAELKGCLNDVENIKNFVQSQFGFHPDHCRVLTDDPENHEQPTRENIMKHMHWLIQGAQPGDSLFFHYSGHGSQQKDQDGDEADGMDETICPKDYATAGMISDDELFLTLVEPLPAGARLTAIFDCCHSQSILDLPFVYTVDGNLQIHEETRAQKVAKTLLKSGMQYLSGRKEEAMKDLIGGFKSLGSSQTSGGNGPVNNEKVEQRLAKADVVCFSGCLDNQTSADASIEGQSTGAMSYAFIKAMKKFNQKATFKDLLKEIRLILQDGYSQVPQMSAGKRLPMDIQFNL